MAIFDKLQSMGGNYISRLGGVNTANEQQLAGMTPQARMMYDAQKQDAKTAGMREFASRLSDAFGGRDIVGRASQRSQARDAQEIKNYEKTKLAKQQQLDQFKKGLDLPTGLSIGGKTLLIGNRLANAGFIDESLPYFQMADKYTDKLTDQDKFSFEKDLRKEYDTKTKDVKQVLDRARTLKTSLLQKTGIGDIQAIFAFMQAADPGSRVTEGELRLTQGAGGALSTLLNMYNNYKEGDVFPQETRNQIWQLVSNISADQVNRLDTLNTNYTGLAENYGVSADNVIAPYDFDLSYITGPLSVDGSDGSDGSNGSNGSAKNKKH